MDQFLVLLNSVILGFGSQSFIVSALRKAEKAGNIIDTSDRDVRQEIDGRVKMDIIRRVDDA